MENEFEPLLRMLKVLVVERDRLFMRGPRFCIYHRFWHPETVCTPGEAILEIRFVYRTKQISLRLSRCLMLLFDYLARHKHVGQCAAQIAAGMRTDPFTRRHGAYAGAPLNLSKRISRTAVKQQIMRLRAGLRWAFLKAGLSLDPCRVLLSEATLTNETLYRLRASISWEHSEF